MDLYSSEDPAELINFINEAVKIILNEDGKIAVFNAFQPILNEVQLDFTNSMVLNFPRSHFALLSSFASVPTLAEVCFVNRIILFYFPIIQTIFLFIHFSLFFPACSHT